MQGIIDKLGDDRKDGLLKEIGAVSSVVASFQRLRIKAILSKDPGKRTEGDIEVIVNLIKGIDFFRTQKMLSYSELRDLAQSLTFEEVPKDTSLILCGEKVTNQDKFYVILQGTVSVLIRNEIVDQWDWAMSAYNALKDWKEKEFDKKVAKAMKAHFERYKREMEGKIDDTIQRASTKRQEELQKPGEPKSPVVSRVSKATQETAFPRRTLASSSPFRDKSEAAKRTTKALLGGSA